MSDNVYSNLAGKRVSLLVEGAFDRMFIEELLDQVDIERISLQEDSRQVRDCDAQLVDFAGLEEGFLPLLTGQELPLIAMGPPPLGVSATAVIDKPIEPDRFYKTIAEVLGRDSGQQEPRPAEEGGPVNFREGLLRLGGNQEVYHRVLKLFMENQKNAVDEISLAIGNADLETATRLAHSVKGVAGNIGANRVQEAALPLEQALKREDLDEARVLMRELDKRLIRTFKAIAEYVGDSGQGTGVCCKGRADPSSHQPQPDWQAVRELLDQLLHACDLRRPVECEAVLERLSSIAWPDNLCPQINQTNSEVSRYRYPAAEHSIRRLIEEIGKMEG
jgi:HPt (histidine-containing phosphotransfer) domain-containing protein